jgi:NAD+ kinase
MCCDIEDFELYENEVIDVMLSDRVANFADYRQVSFLERLKKSFL